MINGFFEDEGWDLDLDYRMRDSNVSTASLHQYEHAALLHSCILRIIACYYDARQCSLLRLERVLLPAMHYQRNGVLLNFSSIRRGAGCPRKHEHNNSRGVQEFQLGATL